MPKEKPKNRKQARPKAQAITGLERPRARPVKANRAFCCGYGGCCND